MSNSAKTRVFLESPVEAGDTALLPEDEARHIFKVLRARKGDRIEVVNPERRLFLAELAGEREARVMAEVELPGEPNPRVTLYQAVPKGKHMDLVVEKVTELGAERIVPLLTDHGEVRPTGESKSARWQRLAEAAARQSLQLRVPEIPEPLTFREAVAEIREAAETSVMLHNGEDLPSLEAALSAAREYVAVFVGPEGGWSEEELRLGSEAGFAVARMGPYRLRSETAGVVAVARAEAFIRENMAKAGVNRMVARSRTE